MDSSTPSPAPIPERRLPAWLFSILLHASSLILVAYLVETAPRGAAEEPGRSAGIVLKRSSADGDLYEGEAELADNRETLADQVSPDELLSVLPSESALADAGRDLPQLPAVGPGAAGGQPSASQFTAGGRPGSALGDGQATVRVFGVEGTGTKFVYVFDRSTSMEGAPLAAAKRQLIESINSLESVHQFQIIFFNHEVQAFDITSGGRRIAFADDRNKELAAKFIGGVTADGGTDRFAALRLAVGLQPDVIFFLTDADDPMSPSELNRIAQVNRRNQATICTIEFGSGPRRRSDNFLVQLASQTSGQYGYVDTTRLPP